MDIQDKNIINNKKIISERMIRNTVRILSYENDNMVGSGTGFVFHYEIKKKFQFPVLVTNKHVISATRKSRFVLDYVYGKNKNEDMTGTEIVVNQNDWIMHPNDDIDLCVVPIGSILNDMYKYGDEINISTVGISSLPIELDYKNFSAMEDIIIIGYPNGIWDKINNLPIVRKGITATPLENNYNGDPKFLVDAAVFPGSSGSPVYIFNEGDFYTNRWHFNSELKVKLIGIIYGCYQHMATGEIIAAEIPTTLKPIPITGIPNNLGIAIKSSVLLDFEPILLERFGHIEEHHHE